MQNQINKKFFPPLWIGYAMGILFTVGWLCAAFFFPEVSYEDMWNPINLAFQAWCFLAFLYWLLCVHKMHKAIYDATNLSYPNRPGRVVILHFIPLYNLYWIYKWSLDLVNFIDEKLSTKKVWPHLPGIMFLIALLVLRFFDGGAGIVILFIGLTIIRRKVKVVLETISSPTQPT